MHTYIRSVQKVLDWLNKVWCIPGKFDWTLSQTEHSPSSFHWCSQLSQHSIYNSEDMWVSWVSVFSLHFFYWFRCPFIPTFNFEDRKSLLVRYQVCSMAVEPMQLCKFWCFHGSIAEDSFLLGYDAAVSECWISTLWGSLISSCIRMDRSYKLRSWCCFKVKGSDYLFMQHHIPEEQKWHWFWFLFFLFHEIFWWRVLCAWICRHGKENSSIPAIVALISFTILLIWVYAVQWPRRIFESLFLLMIFLKNDLCTFPFIELFVSQLTAKCVKTEWETATGSK